MNNQVIGNKPNDNKDPKNQQKAQSSTQRGIVPNQKATYFSPQNSPISTQSSVGQEGDKGVQLKTNRSKKIIRQETSFTDGAIARAKAMRGMVS